MSTLKEKVLRKVFGDTPATQTAIQSLQAAMTDEADPVTRTRDILARRLDLQQAYLGDTKKFEGAYERSWEMGHIMATFTALGLCIATGFIGAPLWVMAAGTVATIAALTTRRAMVSHTIVTSSIDLAKQHRQAQAEARCALRTIKQATTEQSPETQAAIADTFAQAATLQKRNTDALLEHRKAVRAEAGKLHNHSTIIATTMAGRMAR